MKYQRPGYTEYSCLFYDYLENRQSDMDAQVLHRCRNHQRSVMSWSHKYGLYDKTIDFESMKPFPPQKMWYTEHWQDYLSTMKRSLIGSDVISPLVRHYIFDTYPYKNEFRETIESTCGKVLHYWNSIKKIERYIYPIMEGKRILIITPFAETIEQQLVTKTIYKIFPNFPVLNKVDIYKHPWCLNNSGPHNNWKETLSYNWDNIKNLEYDVCLLSCGWYSIPLAHNINSTGKTAITLGSYLPPMFGVDPQGLLRPQLSGECIQYVIKEIPEKYRPDGWESMENGRYFKNTYN